MLGNHFTILTIHKIIEYFLGERITTPAQQKWLLKLIGYDYSIHYKAGKNNVAPDALSRKGEFAALTRVSRPVHQFVQDIQKAYLHDDVTKEIIKQLSQGTVVPHFTLHNA